MTNVKLVNKFRENGGEYMVRPDHPADMLRVTNDLHAYRQAEADADWHIEYRGSRSDWHREGK